jgi:ribonuclease P protein component
MAGSVYSSFPNISTSHEKNVPALSKASCPPIRFPRSHAHQERSRHPGPTQGEGTCPSRRQGYGAEVCPSYRSLGLSAFASDSPESSGSRPSENLPRARVIRRRKTFDAARNQGRRVSSRYFSLNLLPHDPTRPDQATVAFLTPKRLGAATVRNRLRRRMREIYRRHLPGLPEKTYLVWVARPPAVELEFEELKRRMLELKERLR